MTEKRELRGRWRQLRRQHNSQREAVCQAVQAHLLQSTGRAGFLGLYWPLADEVDLRPLARQLAGPLALPVADGRGG
ncbi:MAG: 5-formyltetrahydrofolate cyclo-ligase, partial [Synechococcus sp.]